MADSENRSPLYLTESARDNAHPDYQDDAWVSFDIDQTRWNKSFPYQLLVLRKENGAYIEDSAWRFTLPIPPQDLTISTPFAITTTVTLGGIVEEHNGAPIRMISFSGTTGVLPLRGAGEVLKASSSIQGILAGTITAATRVAQQVEGLITSSQTGTRSNLVDETAFDGEAGKGTGYYQFRLLQKFLESYITIKKSEEGRHLRLAVALWKDQAVYLVTPVSFDVRRTAGSPWEYNYSLNFRTWRRVVIGRQAAPVVVHTPIIRDPSGFANLLNQLQAARRVLQASRAVLQAVRGDIDNLLFEPLREVALFCKDALGVAAAAADLPKNVIRDMKSAVLEAASLQNAPAGIAAAFDAAGASIRSDIQSLAVTSSKAETGASDLGTNQDALSGAHEGNTPFDNPADNYDFFAEILPSELNLRPSVQAKIVLERERVRRLTRLDFEKARDVLVEFTTDFADAVGAGSDSYNQIFGRPSKVVTKTPTSNDYDALFALNQAILQLNKLSASNTIDRFNVTTLEQMAGLARRSGIAFTTPVSKFAVPFPYNHTLEQLSALYLGTPDRWHEIAALNGLRTPYVDEEGFDLELLTNGRGNEVTVSSADNLFVGQPIWISSSNAARTRRHITSISRNVVGPAVLSLDGDHDLDIYTTMAQATLHAFLPDTVNSQMQIFIPSQETSNEDDFASKAIPGLDEFDNLIRVGGIDLLLSQTGDLVITPDGDCRLAYGMTNIVQKVRVALSTPKGSLLHHADYGLEVPVGSSTADLSSKELLKRAQSLFDGDPTFTGITGASVRKDGPLMQMTIAVGVTGAAQVIPITVDVKQS